MQPQYSSQGRRRKIVIAQVPVGELMDEQIPKLDDFSTLREGANLMSSVSTLVVRLRRAAVKPANIAKAVVMGSVVTAVAFRPGSALEAVADLLARYRPESRVVVLLSRAAVALGTGAMTLLVSNQLSTWALRALLCYKGFIYTPTSPLVKVWGVAVKALTVFSSGTYSLQRSMPHLPVPSLKNTVRKYLRSIEPLVSDDHYAKIEAMANEFLARGGPKLQFYLVVKSWLSINWLEEWWEKYVYLKGRGPIMINSNFYTFDCAYSRPGLFSQEDRAASTVYFLVKYRQILDAELQPPVMAGPAPLCMAGFERIYGTTRVPGREMDELVFRKHKDSRHVAVLRKGHWYAFSPYDPQGKPLPAHEILHHIRFILKDAAAPPTRPGEADIAALTAGSRTPWAALRESEFASGINKKSLEVIESAAFVLVLDDDSPKDVNSKARSLIAGRGNDRWFDKSFNAIIFSDGTAGFNVEHSYADATVAGYFVEWAACEEFLVFKEKGWIVDPALRSQPGRKDLPAPHRLLWDIKPAAVEVISASLKEANALINDLDQHLLVFEVFGKGFAKQSKIGPDGFIQAALQVAYYRDAGHFCQTYESASTRLFRHGRTETIRSCSTSMADFVLAMCNVGTGSTPKTNAEKRALLRTATDDHVQYAKMASAGQGVDRHLFGLYVIAVGIGMDPVPEFLADALSKSWTLSTSQTPSNQTGKWNASKEPGALTIGGGFGPVDVNGYGVSYIISGENRITFHVASRVSSEKTNSKRFADHINQALLDMRDMCLAKD
jgi:carnitine O-palmitoyltransferase 1